MLLLKAIFNTIAVMITVEKNKSLRHFNTFGIDVNARYLFHLHRPDELQALTEHHEVGDMVSVEDKLLVVGQGSNMLFTSDFDGLVIINEISGIRIISEDESGVVVEAGAGVIWNDLVEFAVANNFAGIENLFLIPGTVGATPVQNIGAYGVEAAETIEKVRLYHTVTREWLELNNQECRFGYRDSIFKNELKNRAVICSVTFRLSKRIKPRLEYGNIREELEKRRISDPSLRQISDVIADIRRSKLPDPAVLGNAGSFFKNPVVSIDELGRLRGSFSGISYFEQGGRYKIPAGWLIEQAGWKGHRSVNTGCYEKQALILVNYGGAAGSEVLDLALRIRESVQEKFGIRLESEVNIVPGQAFY
ncbi:MAG TPA: UDP-N-acetylmuramate dehydrogenase [Bacteroidales bacterium]|nr:UDP-N-acetylmuramate dehydrogenase [Bacteroidales bacterium]HNX65818.1 UDP-N-acetylmuramate dehydrogenase [Bacteroidales bacterium]